MSQALFAVYGWLTDDAVFSIQCLCTCTRVSKRRMMIMSNGEESTRMRR